MQTIMTHDEAKTWATLSLEPLLCLDKKTDTYIVYWCGWVVEHSVANVFAALKSANVSVTPKIKDVVWKNHERAWQVGAFGKVSWTIGKGGVNTVFKYLESKTGVTIDTNTWEIYKKLNDFDNAIIIQ